MAEELILRREQVGEDLMAIVSDADRLISQRHEAARLLGELKHLPAIELLLRHVDLVDPTYMSYERRPDLAYPVTVALAAYGTAAVPQIVDACLVERNQQRQILFAYALRFADRSNVALRYVRGIEPKVPEDWLQMQNAEALERRLRSLAGKTMPAGEAER